MAVALTTKEVRSALASALGSAGYNPVGGLLVKSFEESFAAVGISKDAFRRCWRFTWHFGMKQLSPWFREPSDFRDVSGEISQIELHWMSSEKAAWVAPFLTDVAALAVNEVQLPSIFDGNRVLTPSDSTAKSNVLHRIAFADLECCVSTIANEGVLWLERYTSLARLAEDHCAGSLFYFHLVPKAQALIAG